MGARRSDASSDALRCSPPTTFSEGASRPDFPWPARRYVIDETIGAISIFHNFAWIDAGLGPYHPGTPASQMFRVENGMNRYIHEVTVCTTPGCSRGGPGGPPPGGN